MDIDRAVETQLQNIERATGTSRAQWFERIRGHKPFDASQSWFLDLLTDIGQV